MSKEYCKGKGKSYQSLDYFNETICGTLFASFQLLSLVSSWCLGAVWPTPYETDMTDLYETTLNDCTQEKEFCIDDHLESILCRKFTIPCAVSFNVDQKSNVSGLYFGGDWDYSDYTDISNLSVGAVESALESGFHEILSRANSVGSFYCVYMAVMIFCGAPYVLTSYRMKTKIQFLLGNLSKPWFIVCALLTWYSMEIAKLFYHQVVVGMNVFQILGFAVKDPCFLDPDFMNTVYSETSRICSEIEHSELLFQSSQRNLAYYNSIEETYRYYYWSDDNSQNVPYKATDRLFEGDVLSAEGMLYFFE